MSFTITPSTVAAGMAATPKGLTTDRRSFYAGGYFYVFYEHQTKVTDSRVGYKSAPVATMAWSAETILTMTGTANSLAFGLWYDYVRNRVHLCWSDNGTVTGAMYYRMGTPSGGNITWADEVELDYTPNTGGVQAAFFPNIACDSSGYPIISYIYADDGNYSTHVCKSTTKDGTWTEKGGWPLEVNAGAGMHTQVVPLATGNFAIFGVETGTLKGYLWNEATSTLSDLLTQAMHASLWFNAVGIGNEIRLVYSEETSGHLIHRKYTWDTGIWDAAVHVHASAVASPCVCKDRSTNDIYCIWFDSPTANAIYYSVRSGGVWSDAAVLATDPTFYDAAGVSYQNCFYETPSERYVGITWPITNGSDRDCRFGAFALTATMTVTAVAPDQSERAVDDLSVVITGTGLMGVTSVSFGLGITVNSFVVDSDTQITANIDVALGATVGYRDITVTSDNEAATLVNGFHVIIAPSSLVPPTPPSANPPGNEWSGNIYSTSGDYVGSIGGWLRLNLIRRVNGPDRIELRLDGRHPAVPLLSTDCIAEFIRGNNALGIAPYKETEGLFRNPLHDWDEKGQYVYTGIFAGYEDLLDRRVLLGGDDEAFASANLPAETVMKQVVEVQCGVSGTRKILTNSIQGLTVEHSMHQGPTYKGYSKGQRLLGYLQDIADSRNMAFRVVRGPTPATFKFRAYPNPYGADRTIRGLSHGKNTAGKSPVVFSIQRRNVSTVGYHVIHDGEANIAIDDVNKRITMGPGATDSPWSASEFLLTVGPDENADAVADRDLAKVIAREEALINVIQTPACCYGRHYFLGDWVTVYVTIPGQEKAVTKAITEVDITVERREGQMAESISIVLADRPIPLQEPLQESIMNLTERMAKAERRLT